MPNPSFEDSIACPLGGDQLYKAINWYSFRNTPDYFHTCCTNQTGVVGVPNNIFGYQIPNSGNAYAGMIAYDLTGQDYREFLGVDLISPTIVNQKYYCTFYISWAVSLGYTIAINKIGIELSKNLFSTTNPYPINNFPIAYSDTIIQDSIGWRKMQFSFIADSAYEYLIIGNFFNNLNTDTLNLGQFNVHSYYYIDDVCLSTDSVYCSIFTLVNQIEPKYLDKIIKSYSIQNHSLNLSFYQYFLEKKIFIYSTLGQKIFCKNTYSSNEIVNLPLTNSLYILKVYFQNGVETIKILNQ